MESLYRYNSRATNVCVFVHKVQIDSWDSFLLKVPFTAIPCSRIPFNIKLKSKQHCTPIIVSLALSNNDSC